MLIFRSPWLKDSVEIFKSAIVYRAFMQGSLRDTSLKWQLGYVAVSWLK